MIECRKNLAFLPETMKQFVRIHAALQNFDGYKLFVALIRALRKINSSHSAAADFLKDFVDADLLAAGEGQLVFIERFKLRSRQRLLDKIAGGIVG